MAATIYENIDVKIEIEVEDTESKVNVNGKRLMWISTSDAQNFKKELSDLLDKYRI